MAVATLRHPVNPQCKSIKTLASTKVHFVAFMLFHSCAISSELDLYYSTKVHFVAFMLFHSCAISSELNLYYSTKVHFVAFMLFHSCAISSELESLILEITKPQLSLRLMFSFLVGKTGFEPATTWSQTRYATGLRYFPFLLLVA